MKTFAVKVPNQSDRQISGNTLTDAISKNFKQLAGYAGIGNAAGYKLQSVSATFERGILGGVAVTMKWTEQEMAHRPASTEVQTSTIWIHADAQDMPEPHTFAIGKSHENH